MTDVQSQAPADEAGAETEAVDPIAGLPTVPEVHDGQQYKVRWALVSYTTPTHPQKLVFRGMVIDDIDADTAADLVKQGALVAANTDLDRPGELLPLATAPSNEELMNWVMGASQVEIDQEIAKNPAMAGRLREAWAVYQQMTQSQLELLGQRVTSLPEGTPVDIGETAAEVGEPQLATAARSQPSSSAQVAEKQYLGEVPQTELTVNADYFDQVVQANVDDVARFLSQYPQYAEPVLEAEKRRADAQGGDIRKGVENAVQAAAAFTQ